MKIMPRVTVAAGLPDEELVAIARASERVQGHLDGGEARKVIVVPDRLVNFVI